MESVGRSRLSRAPHMRYKYLLPTGAQSMGKALEYFRRVAKEADSSRVRAVASEREFICETMRILFSPSAPPGTGWAPPAIRPGGLANTLGVLRAVSRMVEDAARAEATFFAFSMRVSVIC